MRSVSDRSCVEYIQKLFSSENHAVYEVMLKNIVDMGRQQMTLWRTCIACWVP